MTTPPPPSDAPGQPPLPPMPPPAPQSGGPLLPPAPPGAPVYGYPHPDPPYGYPPQAPSAGYGYPEQASAGYGYPEQAQAPAPQGQPLVTLGDIAVTTTGIVTPSGVIPLKGAVWTATDLSRTEEKISTAGIVLAIVFFLFCLIGLLFLLMKERTTVGHIQITVNGGGRFHSTSIPVNSPQQVADIMNKINYARGLAA